MKYFFVFVILSLFGLSWLSSDSPSRTPIAVSSSSPITDTISTTPVKPELQHIPLERTSSPTLPIGHIIIDYEGIFEGRCDGRLENGGMLFGLCINERILGQKLKDASFGEPRTLTGYLVSDPDDPSGMRLSGTIEDEVRFEGSISMNSASGIWQLSSPQGWQAGGHWRAVVTIP